MTLSFTVNQPIATVFDYLTNLQKFAQVHPVIFKIDELGDHNFLAHETLKIGFLPISFTYPFRIVYDKANNKIDYFIVVMKVTKIHMSFRLATNGSHSTFVEETILLQSSLPIKSTMEKIFKTQHAKLFQNIEEALS